MLQPRSRQHAKRRRGFTLIELLISVGLLSLLLVLISQLFNESSTAVSTSVRTSAVIANARSVGTQMDTDFKNMLGPSSDLAEPGGFLVIVNQQIPNVAFPEPRNGGEFTQPFIRSDHIAFISTAPNVKPIAPRNASTYGSTIRGSGYTRITYGHAQRTNRDGTPRTGAGTGIGGPNADLDRLGTELILGRHALIFAPPPTTPGVNDVNIAIDRYTDRWQSGRAVANDGSTITNPRLFHGLTDITTWPYFGGTQPLYAVLRNQDTSNPAAANTNYRSLTFVDNRLQVNPAPSQDITNSNNESWRIAQTHGIFAPNCSEFIVQFAGDLDNDGELDTADTTGTPGLADDFIIWYDAFNQNLPGTPGGPAGTPWGTMTNGGNGTYLAGATPNDPHVFIFRVGDAESNEPAPGAGAADNSKWPVLIRIRYRLHDARGRITGYDGALVGNGIDESGSGADDDSDGAISGQWFEQIYRVPRPALPQAP
jgi:prepilin-type N-terminal cleavage/methylation domain-containing protein